MSGFSWHTSCITWIEWSLIWFYMVLHSFCGAFLETHREKHDWRMVGGAEH